MYCAILQGDYRRRSLQCKTNGHLITRGRRRPNRVLALTSAMSTILRNSRSHSSLRITCINNNHRECRVDQTSSSKCIRSNLHICCLRYTPGIRRCHYQCEALRRLQFHHLFPRPVATFRQLTCGLACLRRQLVEHLPPRPPQLVSPRLSLLPKTRIRKKAGLGLFRTHSYRHNKHPPMNYSSRRVQPIIEWTACQYPHLYHQRRSSRGHGIRLQCHLNREHQEEHL